MKVSDVMSNRVVTLSPQDSYKAIWSTFFTYKINAVPVVDKQHKLLGIITKEDLLKSLYPNYLDLVDDFSKASDFDDMEEHVKDLAHVTAKELMNSRVVFTRVDTPAMRALSRMIAQRLNQLPVLSEDDQVVGMVTKGDVFKGLFKNQVRKMKSVKIRKAFVGV